MQPAPQDLATIDQPSPQTVALSGQWTVRGVADIEHRCAALLADTTPREVDAAGIVALDSAGAWRLQELLLRLATAGSTPIGLKPQFQPLLKAAAQRLAALAEHPDPAAEPPSPWLERVGRRAAGSAGQALALLSFIGEVAISFAGSLAHPTRWRLRPMLFNLRSGGVDALPIVGLLSFLLGVVVAYQGADQLRQYGANIFVADLVGLSMLREFAPLMTAIIIAGRSGSAYAAQIGTMVVTEEIDAMRTLGIAPLELLVWPKIIALVIAMPLLTFVADLLGVFGGMLMARVQLGVGFEEFLDRFVKAVSPTAYLIGIAKAPVFAVIIVVVGCFQGFRTKGGADAVGRQTTRSVVQSIFLVIVADALFSVAFSALDL